MTRYQPVFAVPSFFLLVGCSRHEQEDARRKIRESGQELKHEVKEAGRELKHDAHEASREIKKGAAKVKQKADSQ